ncbi:TPA: isopeptide-forming domain-containing fimbrial protein [Enterococcus faecium]|nr:isopeptide-forming domain-containing fimbrial protein [Enterococcus faecium]HAQ1511324.1 isopeptide-forming domain-containing fimbrial protein [Enterococcus faecium]
MTDSSNHKLTTIHLYPKSEQKIPAALTLTKTVENKQTDFADGDKVPYLITVTIPENINEIGTYTIKDTADPQLWLEPETIDFFDWWRQDSYISHTKNKTWFCLIRFWKRS